MAIDRSKKKERKPRQRKLNHRQKKIIEIVGFALAAVLVIGLAILISVKF